MTLELSPAYDHPAHALQFTRDINSGQCGDTGRLGRQKEHTLCSRMTHLHFLEFLTSLSIFKKKGELLTHALELNFLLHFY